MLAKASGTHVDIDTTERDECQFEPSDFARQHWFVWGRLDRANLCSNGWIFIRKQGAQVEIRKGHETMKEKRILNKSGLK